LQGTFGWLVAANKRYPDVGATVQQIEARLIVLLREMTPLARRDIAEQPRARSG
jgi:hypothetical protein